MKQKLGMFFAGVGALVLLSVLIFSNFKAPSASASIAIGNEYTSTTTTDVGFKAGVVVTDCTAILSGTCSLGSVVITGPGTSAITIIDATTTDVTKRTGNLSTTTQTRVFFPVTTTAGTYQFDLSLKYGLIVLVSGTNIASTTITSRQ